MSLGKLEYVSDLRKIWKHEASDFTPWLADEDNIALLSEAIGIDITVNQTESPVGKFSVDILASETGTDRKIIIENQLEETNHDHLGKTITYAAGTGAEIIVWIVKKAREEHRLAIDWFNSHTDENIEFFLVQLELWKIGDSEPAVKFNVVEAPNGWGKQVKTSSQLLSATQELKLAYWTEYREYAFSKNFYSSIFKPRKAAAHHWYNLSVGSSEFGIVLTINTQENLIAADVYINNNKELFDEMLSKKQQIEDKTGLEFEWKRADNKKASRIIVKRKADVSDRKNWKEQFEWLMDVSVKIKKAFAEFI